MCDCALTRLESATMVSFTDAVLNTSPKPSTVTCSAPEKHCWQMGRMASASISTPDSFTSNRSASARTVTETSRCSPKCSSQNRLESACFSLFAVRVEKLCSCVACTSDSMCFLSSSSVSSSSFSACFTSLPLDAREMHRHTVPPASWPSAISSSRSSNPSSSLMQLCMLSRMTLVLLSFWFSPSTMPSIWSSRREHRVAV